MLISIQTSSLQSRILKSQSLVVVLHDLNEKLFILYDLVKQEDQPINCAKIKI
jgi:hypothetical protein